MARRRKKQKDSLLELLVTAIFLLSIYIYIQSQSVMFAISTFVLMVVILVLILNVVISINNQKLLKSGIIKVDQMKGSEFEKYLGVLFRKLGYETKVTQSSGDYGADLILKRNGKKIVVQAKRYKKNVGIKAVQEISSAKLHYNAHEAWVVTNSYYTSAAKELARSNQVKLFHREDLISWGNRTQK